MRRLLPLLILAAAMPALAPAQDLDPNRVIATVNGEEIKAPEYYRRLEWFRPEPQSALVTQPAGFQVLRQMISERMIVQLAKSKGVMPTTPQIDARVAEIYKENPNLKTQLAEAGRTEADLRSDFLNQEAQFNLLTSGLTITDLQVEKYYKDNPDQFKVPKTYKLRMVAVNDDATAKQVDDSLKLGKSFADVATQFSMDITTKTRGGEYGVVPETALAEATRKAIEITPLNSTTTWVQGGTTARVKFLVEEITPGKVVPLDAELKPKLRRRVMLEQGTARNKDTVSKDLKAATQAAKVVISIPQFQQIYTQLLDRVKNAQGQG
jgi:foldase protein PrsA